MKYFFLRIFLIEMKQLALPTGDAGVSRGLSREDYIRRVLSKRIDFMHRKSKFAYVPVARPIVDKVSYQAARVGRLVEVVEAEPPEADLTEVVRPSWRAANVFVDAQDFSDGQKIACQYHPSVGRPLSVFQSLATHINGANQNSGWWMYVNSITEKSNFWKVVEENEGEISEVSFRFVTPNILRMRSTLNEDLKLARSQHNASTVTVGYENPNGNLQVSGAEMVDAVNYISEGGGVAKIKSGKRTIFDSSKHDKNIEIENDEPLSEANAPTRRRFIRAIFGK